MTPRRLTPLPETTARRLAHILGPSCAVAKALHDYEARKQRGEPVALYLEGNAILVGPQIPPEDMKP